MLEFIFFKEDGNFRIASVIGALIVIAIMCVIGYNIEYGSEHNVTFTVTSVDDQSTSNGHRYLVFTTSGDTYEDVDDTGYLKFNSSDIYSLLLQHPHGTFSCNVHGYRRHLTSSYPNLLSCTFDH